MPTFSFEFFPAKTEKGAEALRQTSKDLAALGPKYMTVTYGAGGSTRDGTLSTIKAMQDDTGLPVAGHLTFINTTKQDLKALTDQWWDEGIHHIVALRGDMPDDLAWPLDDDGDYFQYTSEFVEALKSWHDFEISVGAYPEKHPDAPSLNDDIHALKLKCDAGADQAKTQFFFDNDCFYRFRDSCAAAGIKTPIQPGLLPIHDFEKMKSFAARCQASVPRWIEEKLERFTGQPEDIKATATDILQAQVDDLIKNDVPHIHFYTLNKTNIVHDVCRGL